MKCPHCESGTLTWVGTNENATERIYLCQNEYCDKETRIPYKPEAAKVSLNDHSWITDVINMDINNDGLLAYMDSLTKVCLTRANLAPNQRVKQAWTELANGIYHLTLDNGPVSTINCHDNDGKPEESQNE